MLPTMNDNTLRPPLDPESRALRLKQRREILLKRWSVLSQQQLAEPAAAALAHEPQPHREADPILATQPEIVAVA
jgi:hypothetical protein